MHKLILLRHGESDWNRENRFTGWTDVDLSEVGIEEARRAGQVLLEQGFTFDVAFTSVLKRAIRTLWIVLDAMDLMWIPVHRSWRLNERHYGALQGLNKAETAAQYGEEQVKLWRRSYDIRPPALENLRSALSRTRSPLRRPFGSGIASHRVLERHRRAFSAVLARDDCPGHPGRQASAHRRTRQQPAGFGEAPRAGSATTTS